MDKLVPAHFCDDRAILRELIDLFEGSTSRQQQMALSAAFVCTLARMQREYIEIRPGRFIRRAAQGK